MSYAGPASHTTARATAPRTPAPRTPAPRGAKLSTADTETDYNGPALFAAGIALGVVVGAGMALLFAPQSGSETRHDIVRRGRRVSTRGRDAWDDLGHELRHALSRRLTALRRHRAHGDPEAD